MLSNFRPDNTPRSDCRISSTCSLSLSTQIQLRPLHLHLNLLRPFDYRPVLPGGASIWSADPLPLLECYFILNMFLELVDWIAVGIVNRGLKTGQH